MSDRDRQWMSRASGSAARSVSTGDTRAIAGRRLSPSQRGRIFSRARLGGHCSQPGTAIKSPRMRETRAGARLGRPVTFILFWFWRVRLFTVKEEKKKRKVAALSGGIQRFRMGKKRTHFLRENGIRNLILADGGGSIFGYPSRDGFRQRQ